MEITPYSQQHYFASTQQGLETLLASELEELGASRTTFTRGGVSFECMNAPYRIILQTRLASRIYQKLARGKVSSTKDLYEFMRSYRWHQLFIPQHTFKVHTIVGGDSLRDAPSEIQKQFKNSLYISQIAKDGVVDRFRDEKGQRPSVDTHHPEVTILLHLKLNAVKGYFEVEVSTDLCGESLGNRFYREGTLKAPLKEPLACGMLKLMNWKSDEEMFIDTMCGSGTMLIEALMLKAKIPPSSLRVRIKQHRRVPLWSLEYLKSLSTHHWEQALNEVEDLYLMGLEELKTAKPTIYGFDHDRGSIGATQLHLNKLGAGNSVILKQSDAVSVRPPVTPPGIVFANPPYGHRLQAGEDQALGELYYNYGENLKKNFAGFRAYIFTTEPTLRKQVQLRTKTRTPLFNGPLEGRLYEYSLY